MYWSILAALSSFTSLIVSRLGAQLRLSPHDARNENPDISRCMSPLPHWRHSGCLSADQLYTRKLLTDWQAEQRYS